MSRVRIYELAREAGISSKALVAKLVELGYDVKGHSSTVGDDVADVIRKTVLGNSDTELVEKRISGGDSGSTVIRRRSTIIRRKAKVVEKTTDEAAEEVTVSDKGSDEEVSVQDAVAEAAEKEQVKQADHVSSDDGQQTMDEKVVSATAKVTEEKQAEAAEKSEPESEETASEKVEDDGAERGEGVIEKVTEKQEKASVEQFDTSAETISEEGDTEIGEETISREDGKEKGAKAAKKKEKAEKKKTVRKSFARVVGSIEIPVEEESTQPAKPRKRPNRHTPKDSAELILPGDGETESRDSGRAKKKGRRSEPMDSDDDHGRRGRGKKARKSVKYTHFDSDYQRPGRRGKKGGKSKKQPQPGARQHEMKAIKKRIKVFDTITVGDLAGRMRVKASEVIAKLMGLGVMATMNQSVDVETAMLIASDFGYEVEQGVTEEIGIRMLDEEQTGGERKPRPPVVTVMGHVDHGKTSILDAIRKTDVADGEAGGITQHIGAYHVKSAAGDVTFVDTPGHAAFTEMRARGAQVTDLVVLVVAADDGVMDQTREAIRHSQAADVPIIVCVNKIDKDNADPDRVKRELAELDLAPEEWGGQTIYCETSAKKNIGIDDLLENIQLMAEILELKADPERKAKGRVVEAKLDKGRGSVATVMVQEGTLRVGDYFVVGQHSGKVRAMSDYRGRKIEKAGPSFPVEVQGMSGVPSAGDEFIVVTDEKMAKSVSAARALKARETELGANSKISLDKLFEQMNEGDVKELRMVLRADVQGTLEAFAKAAEELSTDEIKVKVLHEGTGTITESDILLASASEAIIIGFNVRPTVKVKELAAKENIDVRAYDVIYHALDDIKKAMTGMLEPTFEENVIGTAEVRDTFSVPKVGVIAGSFVSDGKIIRNARVRIVRDGVVIYTGKISSLKRFKDDAKEVLAGFECGIGVENYNDIKVGDNLEAFILEEVEATLE